MTMADFAQHRPGAAADRSFGFTNLTAAWVRAWNDYRAYRSALRELRGLSLREREDVGIVGLDLAQVARAATYGN